MNVKVVDNIELPEGTSEQLYVDVINDIMSAIGGVKNIIIFANNIKITKSEVLRSSGKKRFINNAITQSESPSIIYQNDNSSIEVEDYDFDNLLHG